MNDNKFWQMIEDAWQNIGGFQNERHLLCLSELDEEQIENLSANLNNFIESLEKALNELSAEDLMEFDRITERKLYQIDRSEIHEFTDGSDDGFLYARGFILAMGREYFETVDKNASKAVMDAEFEEMCFVGRRLYNNKFGELSLSEISRETGSNASGWNE